MVENQFRSTNWDHALLDETEQKSPLKRNQGALISSRLVTSEQFPS